MPSAILLPTQLLVIFSRSWCCFSFFQFRNMNFTTRDRDNDASDVGNCAEYFRGGWWYNSCHRANPNGLYQGGSHAQGVTWISFRGLGYSLKRTEIKLRPAWFFNCRNCVFKLSATYVCNCITNYVRIRDIYQAYSDCNRFLVAMYGNELNVHRVHLGAIKVVPRRSHQLVSHNLFFSSPCFNKINY